MSLTFSEHVKEVALRHNRQHMLMENARTVAFSTIAWQPPGLLQRPILGYRQRTGEDVSIALVVCNVRRDQRSSSERRHELL
jgi:hypothetical protein